MDGGVASTIVMDCEHSLLLPQASETSHVRVAVKLFAHNTLVIVERMTIVTARPSAESNAIGGSKSQALPAGSRRAGKQAMAGGIVSSAVMVWLHRLELPH